MSNSLKIVYILDDRYWYPVLVSAKSALMCLGDEVDTILEFILLVEGVTQCHQKQIESELTSRKSFVRFVQLDLTSFKNLPEYHGTKIIWARCKLNSLLPDVHDWACICDGDTLWLRSPSELFALAQGLDESVVVYGSNSNSSETSYMKHLLERGIQVPARAYFCIGFVLLNLEKMRKVNGEKMAEEYIAKYGPTDLPEQDIFNVIFLDRSRILPSGWGVSPGCLSKVPIMEIGLIHYIGSLPWPSSYRSRMSDAEALWWRFTRKYVGVIPEDSQFRINLLKYLIMRAWNLLVRVLPNGLIGGRCRDVRLPIHELLCHFDSCRDA